jgi:hypothetical protein
MSKNTGKDRTRAKQGLAVREIKRLRTQSPVKGVPRPGYSCGCSSSTSAGCGYGS